MTFRPRTKPQKKRVKKDLSDSFELVEKLANHFSKLLRGRYSQDELMGLAVLDNMRAEAILLMDQAFQEVVGWCREFSSAADGSLWNDAWGLATWHRFEEVEPGATPEDRL